MNSVQPQDPSGPASPDAKTPYFHSDEKNQFLNGIGYHGIIPRGQNGTKDRGSLKFLPHQGNKYSEVLGGESRAKSRYGEESRASALRIYEHNGNFEAKGVNRLTFGPDNFKLNPRVKTAEKQQNPELILPITHKSKANSKSSVKALDIKKKAKVYQLMRKELGMSEEKMQKLKSDTLNYELEQFARRKGLEYLQENHERGRKVKTEIEYKSQQVGKEKSNSNSKSKLEKYPNYIPEVFPRIEKDRSSRKTVFSQNNKVKQIPKKLTRKQVRLHSLNDQQEMLGKIVYDKVQGYFKLDQQKADYFQRVKYEQKIDQAWIQYLRTKVDRADLIFK